MGATTKTTTNKTEEKRMRTRIKKIIACATKAGLLSIFDIGCTGICAEQTSTEASLVILQEPQSQFVALNSTENFSVVAMHTVPPTTNAVAYQRRFNPNDIAGASNPTYSVANVQCSDVLGYALPPSRSTLPSGTAYLGVFSAYPSGNSGTSSQVIDAAPFGVDFQRLQSGNGGALSQVIDVFGNGTASCVAGTWKTYSFPTNAPYYAPPAGTTKLSIDTFDTRNGTWDTAARVVQRAPLYSPQAWCNNDSPNAPSYNLKLSQVTNVTTQASSYYQFIIYVNGTPPSGTVFYLNYLFY